MRKLVHGFVAPAMVALVMAGAACDEDVSTKPRDASPDRTIDTGGGTDVKLDTGTTADTGVKLDTGATGDTGGGPDGGGTPDAAADMAPTPDMAIDAPAPDASVDQAPPPPDMSPDLSPDLAPDLAPDTSPDAMVTAPLEINGCTAASFMDATGGLDQRTMVWGPANLFDPLKKCIRINVGQTVRWAGDFTAHPLVQDEGTTPTPIAGKSGGGIGIYDVVFTTAGTFGYLCTEHGSMTGAVHVVP